MRRYPHQLDKEALLKCGPWRAFSAKQAQLPAPADADDGPYYRRIPLMAVPTAKATSRPRIRHHA